MGTWSGFFISFEGLDGAGKSTQVASLAGSLRAHGHDVVTVNPSDTNLGEILHSFVLEHQRGAALEPWAEALLFNAERAQLLHEVVLPALQRGSVVIADRYADSTIAYQGGGRLLSIESLLGLHRNACGDVWPDLTFYLQLPVSAAARRQRAQLLPLDRFEAELADFHARVAAAFDDLAAANPQRVVTIDAARPAMAVSQDIEQVALERVPPAAKRRAAG